MSMRKIIKDVNSQLSAITTNVKTFGAKGDGTTDDTLAIQSAINYLNALGGGTLYFPNGIYLSDMLTMYSNIKILGQSRWKTIVKLLPVPTGALFECSGISGTNKQNITFEEIHLQHIWNYTTADITKGILINGAYTMLCQVNNCVFDNYSIAGICLEQISVNFAFFSWQIHGCIFNNKGNGVSIQVYGVWCRNAGEYADISGNMFFYCQSGVYLLNSANNRVVDNHFNACSTGVYALQNTLYINHGKALIANNTINHCTNAGIQVTTYNKLDNAISLQSGCNITGNMVLLPSSIGIELFGGYGSIVANNKILMLSASNNGLHIHDVGTSYIVDYCQIHDNIIQTGIITNTTTGTHNDIRNNMLIP